MQEVTLAESIRTVIVLIIIGLGFTAGVMALTYVIMKPIVGWVLDPLKKEADE